MIRLFTPSSRARLGHCPPQTGPRTVSSSRMPSPRRQQHRLVHRDARRLQLDLRIGVQRGPMVRMAVDGAAAVGVGHRHDVADVQPRPPG